MEYLSLLGKLAAISRKVGLKGLINFIRDNADKLFMKIGYFPLKVTVEGVVLSGFFRHRSFLDGLRNQYEQTFKRHLFMVLSHNPNAVFIDGGAHIGLYTILARRKKYFKGRILAFEPDPFNFVALVCNLKQNNCHDDVYVFHKALTSIEGILPFYSSPGTIGSSLIRRSDIGSFSVITVEAITVDQALKNIPLEKLIIKLDIEGGEPLAIQGMKESLLRANEIHLFMEINPSALESGGWSPERLVELLVKMGFDLYFIDENKGCLEEIQKFNKLSKGNIYGVRKK